MVCYECKERTIGCHSICERWLEVERINREKKLKIEAAKIKEREYFGFHSNVLERNKIKGQY